MDLHEMCSNVVSWAANCPEATVSVWFISAIMMIFQIFSFTKRVIYGNNEVEVEVTVPVDIPYVPNDNIIKLIKLLKNQESGWSVPNDFQLIYGKLRFYRSDDKIVVYYNSVDVDLSQNSESPDLDQYLLKQHFNQRIRIEKSKLREQAASSARVAKHNANKELSNILETL